MPTWIAPDRLRSLARLLPRRVGPIDRGGRIQVVVSIAGVLVGIALTTVAIAGILDLLPIPNLSVLYLLPVMFCAVTWGWWTALGAAVLAFVSYDFFFVEPRFTFTIRDPEEWLSLVIFLVVAAVTSNLAARERSRREEARRQARTATLLYELSRSLTGEDLRPGLQAVAERIVQELGLDGAAIVLDAPDGTSTPAAVAGDTGAAFAAGTAARLFAGGGDQRRPGRWVLVREESRRGAGAVRGVARSRGRARVARFPLRREGRLWGMLLLVGRPGGFADDETRLLATIADRIALSLEREQLREEANLAEVLRRTDELRTALLNSVSHDLRTPLAAIKASAESLLQKDVVWSEESRDEFAAAITRESDRLNRLVGNLLDMSRIEGGALRPRRDWYDLGELVREVAARLRSVLAGRQIDLDIPDDLPPVSIDYLMIDQVLTNLFENAAKYAGPETPIRVEVSASEGRVRVAVADRGPGIPPDKREQVFDKFYRLEQRSGIRGSGLGLAVSRGLVEAHGGRIWVEDNPGGGARFVFDLPIAPPPDVSAPLARVPTVAPALGRGAPR